MVSLKLFGGASIDGVDGPLARRAKRRHRLGLLALLAAAHPRAVAREKILAYLWPDRDTERGRNLLNQAVHAVRRALGDGAVTSTGDELRFEPDLVTCDVVTFETALAAGELERAAGIYSGPFLDGFFIKGALEFERWVERERERFRRAYVGALEGLAKAAAERGERVGAVEAWRRLAAVEPYSARVTLRLMEALEATGDRAAAIRQARIHCERMERDFGARPEPEITALAERMRSQPLVASSGAGEAESLHESTANGQSGPGDGPRDHRLPRGVDDRPSYELAMERGSDVEATVRRRPADRNRPRRRLARRTILALGTTAGLAAAAGLAVYGVLSRPDAATEGDGARAPPARAVAVLPFENLTGRDEDAAFAHGMHGDLITALSGVDGLTVISRASVLPYRFDDTPLPQIGEELGVDVLLEGGVQRLGDSVRVNVQLSEAETGRLLWAERYNRELTVGNLFAIQSRITDHIVAALQASLSSDQRERIARPTTEHLTAYQYAHQAVEAFDGTRGGNHESERLLRLAIDKDPGFARAWADLGVFYSWRAPYLGASTSVWDSAAVFARRALRTDPDEPKAYVALAWTFLHQGYLDRDAHYAREALRRNPNDAGALRGLAQSYRDRGEFVEALRHFRAGVRVAPRYLTVRSWVGTVHLDLEQYAEAERWYHSALALRPDWPHALVGLALLHVATGAADSALHYAERSSTRYPDEAHLQAGAAMAAHYLRDFEKVKRYAGRAVELAQPGAPVREMNSLLATTMLGFALLRTGDPLRADSLFAESLQFLEGMVARGADTPRWPYEIGLIRAARGDTEGAIRWLQSAYDAGFRWAWMLEHEPMLDPLRDDLRFRGLLSRVETEVAEMRREVERESTR